MIVEYNNSYKKEWDRFVLNESMNGTFLQSRIFLEYHSENKFKDNSLLIMKGNSIIAVIPANVVEDKDNKKLFAHQGSTFGGIVLGKQYKNIKNMELIFSDLENYLKNNNFTEITLKMSSDLFSESNNNILEYFLFLNEYRTNSEIGYCINYNYYNDDIISNFSASKRRDYKYSLKNNFVFEKIKSKKQIEDFYQILSENYKKFDAVPVHTFEELIEFKEYRLKDFIDFYGVYNNNNMVAGGMVFNFNKKVFHTQYLATSANSLHLYPSEFLYKNLIEEGLKEGYEYISFGTATLNNGKILNKSLAQYKEGFGTTEYINRIFYKKLKI